jgi:hypothetical protein
VLDENSPEIPIDGYRKLVEVYGYWISFHDASVETVLIERRSSTVTIGFETCDMAYRDGDLVETDRLARVVVRWHGVRDLKLEGIGSEGRNWIDGLILKPWGEDILGELELMDGFHGTIVAQRVEIVDAEPL